MPANPYLRDTKRALVKHGAVGEFVWRRYRDELADYAARLETAFAEAAASGKGDDVVFAAFREEMESWSRRLTDALNERRAEMVAELQEKRRRSRRQKNRQPRARDGDRRR